MRLALALAGALVLHAVVLGVGVALLPRDPHRPAAVVALDVDVVPARPDPVAVTPPAPPSHPARHLRPPRAPAFRPAPAMAPRPAEGPPARAPAVAPPAALAPLAGAPRAVAQPVATPAPVRALSAQPRYRTNPAPEYPIAARRLREEGVVFIRVAVAADGRPTTVAVERGCGHPLLDDAAVEAVRRWTFEPARAAGTPVASLVVVPVRFSLSDAR